MSRVDGDISPAYFTHSLCPPHQQQAAAEGFGGADAFFAIFI